MTFLASLAICAIFTFSVLGEALDFRSYHFKQNQTPIMRAWVSLSWALKPVILQLNGVFF
jgi:hypothetical protein